MSWCGVTDEWVEERGRGKTRWRYSPDGERTMYTPTRPRTHLNLGRTQTHTSSRTRADAPTTHSLSVKADLIMVTPISERRSQHGGGRGRLLDARRDEQSEH